MTICEILFIQELQYLFCIINSAIWGKLIATGMKINSFLFDKGNNQTLLKALLL